ncbi:MAG: hypothetical protein HOQ22_02620 [Nocardioidaceae bacterium]|nr:hypothetical protein [Nocardioidaceae bacterium]NUS49919.1 hypothetical protein [Nocardioidaceae bacterium]
MASDSESARRSEQESVVLASFDSYRRAEHMLASLGRGFRKKARNGGGTTAVVVTRAPDGSLRVVKSRVLGAGDFIAALMRLSLSVLVGFSGLFATLSGARRQVRDARVRKGHVGSDEHRAHEILDEAGPDAAIALVRCEDSETRQLVATTAAETALDSWDGSLADFLAALDPGPAHDWVRIAIGEPPSTSG